MGRNFGRFGRISVNSVGGNPSCTPQDCWRCLREIVMNKRLFFPCMLLLLILGSTLHSQNFTDVKAASFIEQKTLVLYDAASGAIPSEALMDFTDFPPGAASLAYADGVTIMDTSISGTDTFAGWVSGPAITSGFPVLDRAAGVQVNFTLQLESEMHTRNQR